MWVTMIWSFLRVKATWTLRQIYQAAPNSVTQSDIQLNLSTMATFGTEESGHCREWFKQKSMYNVWTVRQKSGHGREVAVSGGLTQ